MLGAASRSTRTAQSTVTLGCNWHKRHRCALALALAHAVRPRQSSSWLLCRQRCPWMKHVVQSLVLLLSVCKADTQGTFDCELSTPLRRVSARCRVPRGLLRASTGTHVHRKSTFGAADMSCPAAHDFERGASDLAHNRLRLDKRPPLLPLSRPPLPVALLMIWAHHPRQRRPAGHKRDHVSGNGKGCAGCAGDNAGRWVRGQRTYAHPRIFIPTHETPICTAGGLTFTPPASSFFPNELRAGFQLDSTSGKTLMDFANFS